MHGELQHASHEDSTVPQTGTVHDPRVDVMGVGAHNHISERLVQGKSDPGVDLRSSSCPCSYGLLNLAWPGLQTGP